MRLAVVKGKSHPQVSKHIPLMEVWHLGCYLGASVWRRFVLLPAGLAFSFAAWMSLWLPWSILSLVQVMSKFGVELLPCCWVFHVRTDLADTCDRCFLMYTKEMSSQVALAWCVEEEVLWGPLNAFTAVGLHTCWALAGQCDPEQGRSYARCLHRFLERLCQFLPVLSDLPPDFLFCLLWFI